MTPTLSPSAPTHDPQTEAALEAIVGRHAVDFRLPIVLALLGTAIVAGPLVAAFDLFGHSVGPMLFHRFPAGRPLLGIALVVGVLVVMLGLAVFWNCRRVEARKRRVLADITAVFPDSADHARAMSALRDLPGGSENEVLLSLQNDMRQAESAVVGLPDSGDSGQPPTHMRQG